MKFMFPPRRRKRNMFSLCPCTPRSPENHTFPLGLTLLYGSSRAETGHPPPTLPRPGPF